MGSDWTRSNPVTINVPLLRKRRILGATERFWEQVVYQAETGCLIWTGTAAPNGYIVARINGRNQSLHRGMFTVLTGEDPGALTLDHFECQNKRCFAPDHLEPVTHRVNVLRSSGPAATNARKTRCKQGHPYDAANTRHLASGRRRCKTCELAWNRKYLGRTP